MTSFQFKQLIKEVLREAEAEVEDPKTNTGSGEPLPNSAKYAQGKKDTVIKLRVSGLKDSQIKKVLGKLAYQAMKNDLQVIKAEVESNGSRVAGLEDAEIEAKEREAGKQPGATEEPKDFDIKDVNPAVWKNMSPEKRDKYIKAGSHAEEWEKAGETDDATKRALAKERKAKEAAGTLEYDEETGLPVETKYWTDKEWDMSNSGEDIRIAQSPQGKAAYRPRFGAKQVDPKLQPKGAVRAGFSDTIRQE